MKYLIILLVLLLNQQSYAKDHSIGVHGMVIIPVGERIFASHMPLANSKHAFQILLELDLEGENRGLLNRLLTSNKLVTLMPEVFSLTKLQKGELKSFTATVYTNHFERNGIRTMENATFKVKHLLLNEPLSSFDREEYFVVKIDKQHTLLIHPIGQLPSFDQILLQTYSNEKTSTISVYLETQDFVK